MAEKKIIYTNTETTMEEQWLRSNTDCVYFLASPLTCKKGIDGEFLHSEIARLNPRECRYWFSRNCLNPDCALRHPPFDGPNDGSLEPAPVSKSNVPCYVFFNGFCNKGQSCLFLHELDNANWDSTKTVHTINMELIDKELPVEGNISSGEPIFTLANPYAIIHKPATDRKMANGNDINSGAPIITYASPLENYPAIELSEKNNPSTLQDVSRHFSHQQSSEPLFKQDNISKLDFPLPSRELKKKTSDLSSEQSSEYRVGNSTEQEECESSPSFDVQVNEHDEDSFPCKFDEVNGCYPYGNVDLNLLYPDESIMYENKDYQSSGHFDIENPPICANKSPSHVRNRELDFLHSQRWTSLRSRQASGNGDLCDHLKKRRLMNDNDQDCFSSSTFRSSQNEEMHRNPILKHSQGRLTSQVVIAGVGSHIECRSFKNTQQRIPWLSRRSGHGQHFRGSKSGRKQALNSRKSKPFDEFCEKREVPGRADELAIISLRLPFGPLPFSFAPSRSLLSRCALDLIKIPTPAESPVSLSLGIGIPSSWYIINIPGGSFFFLLVPFMIITCHRNFELLEEYFAGLNRTPYMLDRF